MNSSPISVEEAISRVLRSTKPLPIEKVSINDPTLANRILAEDILSDENIPGHPTSIMDGFAVVAPLTPGTYNINTEIYAGDKLDKNLTEGSVAYITTGGILPEGANAVVKVEDTTMLSNNEVKINVATPIGQYIRTVGSDVRLGQLVLSKGQKITFIEIGLLATLGRTEVMCFKRPIIGIMSTGNELVNPWEECPSNMIRDSNRITLINALREKHFHVIDYGIIKDNKDSLASTLNQASQECDVVITSGGVSMGAADFVKPVLQELGAEIVFSKLNMKPGKPTTFAVYQCRSHVEEAKQVLFFGLPGNPVSCAVTKALFVDVALRRMQGLPSEHCMHPQAVVRLIGPDQGGESIIDLDPERPEYHRVSIFSAAVRQESHHEQSPGIHLLAISTGNQRSSRLLSMRSANGLLILPQGPGKIYKNALVTALLLDDIFPAIDANTNILKGAANIDSIEYRNSDLTRSIIFNPTIKISSNESSPATNDRLVVRTAVLTVSDRAFNGVYEDLSGPEIIRLLSAMMEDENYKLKFAIEKTLIVPDEIEQIQGAIKTWSDVTSDSGYVDLILTTGGTGFSSRDNTPEAIRPLLHKVSDGISQQLLNEGLKYTPLAVLSRPVTGTINRTFIATLPGSVKAVRENIAALKPLLPRIFELLKLDSCSNQK